MPKTPDAKELLVSALSGKAPAYRNRRALPAAFQDASHDLVKVAERLKRLIEDDRFSVNAEQVARTCRYDLLKASDLLATVVERVPNLTKEPTE